VPPPEFSIATLSARALDARLRKPFGIAGGAQVLARNVLVRVELADGTVGHGEAAPFPAFNGETQASTLAAVEQVRRIVEGTTWGSWEQLATAVGESIVPAGAARCGVEMAVLDAIARREGRPIFGPASGMLRTDVTIPLGPVDECAEDARAWVAAGFSRLKIKLGRTADDDALARVLAIHAAAPDAELLLDGNAGLTAPEATGLLRALADRALVPILFEQPCAKVDLDGLAAVAGATAVPVALDETVSTTGDLRRIRGFARRPFVVNVKPMKAGFLEALRVYEEARRLGWPLMIGGMVEGKMAMSASACFAASREGFVHVDLDTPLFFADQPFDGGFAQQGDRIDVSPIRLGHGVAPRTS
jgi:L-alanine-DL-glutamate epimerase-like enolase superfamily enzyme